jgi:hypothetical protein
MLNNDISFLFVTINRPQAAERLIDSIRRQYPEMPIYVGDQSTPTPEADAFYRERGVHARFFPFDSGVSYCRSELVKEITTDYVLFGDDDFVFTEQSQFDVPRRILEEHQHIGLVGGSIFDIYIAPGGRRFRTFRRFEKKIYLDEESQLFLSIPLDYLPPEIGHVNHQQFYYCDMTLNWAFCRRDLFSDQRVLWDPQFKSNGEHENFFLQLKKYSPYRVVYYPGMQCDHHHVGNASYETMRERQEGWLRFGRKWNVVAHLEVGMGLRYYANYENPERYNFLACPRDGSAQAPVQPVPYVRMWPEGYMEAAEDPCSIRVQKLEAQLQSIQVSRTWRLAKLLIGVTAPLRNIGPLRRVVHKAHDALRRARSAVRTPSAVGSASPRPGG